MTTTPAMTPDRALAARSRGAFTRTARVCVLTATLVATGILTATATAAATADTASPAPSPGSQGGDQDAGQDGGRGGGTDATGGTCEGPAGYDAATRDDADFNRTFDHGFADVDGVRMHYVVGGEGPPLVLVHGWPQTWYEWIEVMPALAEDYTVIAVDLPGLGDSQGLASSYDKATLAGYLHTLVTGHLGHEEVFLAAHDMGAGVGYQYAAQYPDEVLAFASLDYFQPGPATPPQGPLAVGWHFGFHAAEGQLAEDLVEGQEREYLDHFYDEFGAREDVVDEEAVTEFARTYSDRENLTAGFELYRTLPQDVADNNASAATPLTMPVLVMSATAAPWDPQAELDAMLPLAPGAQLVGVPDSGHWLSEENPEFVAAELHRFFAAER